MATTSQNEAARTFLIQLYASADARVKIENGKVVADRRESEQYATLPLSVLESDDSLLGLDVNARRAPSSFR